MFRNDGIALYTHVLVGWALALVVAGPAIAADPNGLVAHWAFDGSAVDAGPNSLDGTLIDGAGFGEGILGDGLQLDGAGDYVDVHDTSGAFPAVLGGLSQGTISTWFKFDTFPTTGELHPIFYMGDATIGSGLQGPAKLSATLEIGHFFPNDAKLYWTTYSDSHLPTMCFDTGFNLEAGQWYHFAVTVGPTGNTGYLNGQELVDRHYNFADATSPEFLEDVPAQEELWIGRGFFASTPPDYYFPGTIDEVLVYDRPLSAEEVSDDYQSVLNADGDLDDDGDVDAADIDILRANLGDAAYDLNRDGDADQHDIIHLVENLVEWYEPTSGDTGVGTAMGDFNLDGLVDTTDLTRLATYFGTGMTWAQGNANFDSVIDTTDLTILATYYGYDASADTIPEPATMGLLALGGLALLRRTRGAG